MPRYLSQGDDMITDALRPYVLCKCGQLCSSAHSILECMLPVVTTIRDNVFLDLRNTLQACAASDDPSASDILTRDIGHKLLRLLRDPSEDVDLLWRGIFAPAQLELLFSELYYENMSHRRLHSKIRVLQQLMQPFIIAFTDINLALLHEDDLPTASSVQRSQDDRVHAIELRSGTNLECPIRTSSLSSATLNLIQRRHRFRRPPHPSRRDLIGHPVPTTLPRLLSGRPSPHLLCDYLPKAFTQ